MKRSYLENLYFVKCKDISLKVTKNKKTIAADYRKERENFFKLNTSFVSDNKLFWNAVKPSFFNKGSHGSNVKLVYYKIIAKLRKN